MVEIRDFVKAFYEQKMTIKDFLVNPLILKQMSQEMIELLQQMLEEMGVRVAI